MRAQIETSYVENYRPNSLIQLHLRSEACLTELGFELWIGDPVKIMVKRVKKRKTDREDACGWRIPQVP